MICPNCKSMLPDGSAYCSVCAANLTATGAAPQGVAPAQNYQMPASVPEVNDYKTASLVALILGILQCGIITIVLSAISLSNAGKISSAMAMGDYVTAQKLSGQSKVMLIISYVLIGLGFLCSFIYMLAIASL